MDGSPAVSPPASPAADPFGFVQRPGWLLVLAVVVAGQAGLALDLFGPDRPWAALTDDRPLTAGRHPLHLYHGTLGAATFRERWGTSCYDPAFQAGYPKTPVFDGGCRPAEAVLILAGRRLPPAAAYKLGLFALCLAVPLVFAAAARATGVAAPGACLAAVGGCLVWWSPDCRAMLDAGNVDLLLAGLMGVLFVGGLARYHDDPGLTGWLKLSAAAAVGWYAQPVVWLGLLPVVAAYYVALAPRHGLLWHLGLLGITAAGLAPNLWWLWDWGRFWWLRQPSVDDLAPLPDLGRLTGSAAEYAELIGTRPAGWAVFAVGLVGVVALARGGQRVAAGVVLTAAGLAVVVARLGDTWPTLQVVAAGRVAPFGVAVLVAPAAGLVWGWWAAARWHPAAVLATAAFPAALGWGGSPADAAKAALGLDTTPLRVGLSAEQDGLVRALRAHTATDARILVEDCDATRPGWNWTALLPTLTGRHFLGGLDPDACVEHAFCGLRAGRLNGRPFADWTADERAAFCRRYNVGWVVCRTPESAAWWADWPAAREVGRFRDGGEVVLIELARPRGWVLAGSATVERIDRRGVVLADAVPDAHGELVLSLHHQPGFRAAPTVARVAPDPDPFDPIPLLKLRLPGPVSRVTLTWDNP